MESFAIPLSPSSPSGSLAHAPAGSPGIPHRTRDDRSSEQDPDPEHRGQHPADRLLTPCREGMRFPLPNHLFEGLKSLFCNPVNFLSLESDVLVAELVGGSWGFLPFFSSAGKPQLSPKSNLQLIILRPRSVGAGQLNSPAGKTTSRSLSRPCVSTAPEPSSQHPTAELGWSVATFQCED